MLMVAVKQMLKERGLSDEAVNWIVEDISPRLMFLDGRFPPNLHLARGMTPMFAVAMRKALQEILTLEIELYREKYESGRDVEQNAHPS